MENKQYTREELEAIWEENLKLSVEERLNKGTSFEPRFPGIDNIARGFETMAEYKEWCAKLPKWMGYGKADDENDSK